MRWSRSFALVAALAFVVTLVPSSATSLAYEPAMLALPPGADETVALPLSAPLPTGATGLGPGTYLLSDIDGATFVCSANWVWSDGAAYYLGAAGHCFLPETATSSHGFDRDYDVSTVRVRACVHACEFAGDLDFVFAGTTVELGKVAYARQSKNGLDIGNDFGLVRIPDALVGEIRAALPVWGRTSGIKDVMPGDIACLYGNGLVVGETYLTKARVGTGLATLADGSWRIAIPSAPGDSGTAVATCKVGLDGSITASRASGVLTHLSGAGVAGTTMAKAQQLAREAGLTLSPIL